MNNSLIQTPKNTTKRTGIGCSIIGFSLFFIAFLVLVTGVLLKLEHTYIAIGAICSAVGLLAILPGIGLFFNGRKVDKMLSGEDLIANWTYLIDEKGNRKNGYIYIGTKGFYKNGLFTSWSGAYVLEDVFYTEGNPPRLTFQYVITRHNSSTVGTRSIRKKTSVPVPPNNKEEAMRVISHYKQMLQNSGNNNV